MLVNSSAPWGFHPTRLGSNFTADPLGVIILRITACSTSHVNFVHPNAFVIRGRDFNLETAVKIRISKKDYTRVRWSFFNNYTIIQSPVAAPIPTKGAKMIDAHFFRISDHYQLFFK